MKIATIALALLALLCIHCGGGDKPPEDPSTSSTTTPAAMDDAGAMPEAPK